MWAWEKWNLPRRTLVLHTGLASDTTVGFVVGYLMTFEMIVGSGMGESVDGLGMVKVRAALKVMRSISLAFSESAGGYNHTPVA